MLEVKKIPIYSSKFIFCQDTTMVSYVTHKNENLLLSNYLHDSLLAQTSEQVNPSQDESSQQISARKAHKKRRCFFSERRKDQKARSVCKSCGCYVCSSHSKHFVLCCKCESNNPSIFPSLKYLYLISLQLLR